MVSMAESSTPVVVMAEATLAHLHLPLGIFFDRKDFPKGFLFGSGSSAYQTEGAANEGGRGKSIWDTFTHDHPEKIDGGANGNVAIDGYHRYAEDVGIIKDMNLDVYRFSISWSRILPKGKKIKGLPNDGVNEEGTKFYSDLIDELISHGIVPFVALFHWDVPQALEDDYHGFLSPLVVDDFVEYAKLCFERFGDRVKNWITFNEPHTFCTFGYTMGTHAPGRCSPSKENNFEAVGDSSKEPYLAAHHMLLAHAATFNLYKETQDGQIEITLNTHWYLPYSDGEQDKAATQRALDFNFGWCMDPLFFGEYPKSFQAVIDDRLKNVIDVSQLKRVKGTLDFIGLNYYSTYYAKNLLVNPSTDPPNFAILLHLLCQKPACPS
ncbi:hypothetical protein Scep_003823 [Stephania cephalantha]|uniref:Uncharacterized protein n=1 Tax=Stephania cephalantha TaxID=152367 RepID=A0AAP0KSU3_9MAGN